MYRLLLHAKSIIIGIVIKTWRAPKVNKNIKNFSVTSAQAAETDAIKIASLPLLCVSSCIPLPLGKDSPPPSVGRPSVDMKVS